MAANWKMYKTVSEALAFADRFLSLGPWGPAEAAICPPYPCLMPLAQVLEGSGVALGAQDLHWEKEGAFTGGVSGPMLKHIGCRYVIVGHSERRQYSGDTDERVGLKLRAAFDNDLVPILCVGESLSERESGNAPGVVTGQLRSAVAGLSLQEVSSLVVAYEPIWAIGTGRSAKGRDASDMARVIRGVIADLTGQAAADSVRVLYGGSVKPENAGEFLNSPGVDGALVGGASLDPAAFRDILGSSQGV